MWIPASALLTALSRSCQPEGVSVLGGDIHFRPAQPSESQPLSCLVGDPQNCCPDEVFTGPQGLGVRRWGLGLALWASYSLTGPWGSCRQLRHQCCLGEECQGPVLWLAQPLEFLASQDTIQQKPSGNSEEQDSLLTGPRGYTAHQGPHSKVIARKREGAGFAFSTV